MLFRHMLIPVAAALLLAGCGSSSSASNANFAKAINVQLAKSCISLNPASHPLPTSNYAYPLTMPLETAAGTISAAEADKWNGLNFGPFDALVKVGLLTVADAQAKQQFGNKMVPGKTYSLTDAGKKSLQRPNYISFCVGHYKVAEVVNYSVPGKEIDGTTGSEVNFTYTPAAVPSWATSDAIKATFPSFYQAVAMSQPQKGRADLVLMSNGWQASIDNL